MLFRDYDIDTFFLQDGQSWPIILRTDQEAILCDKSKKEVESLKGVMEGTIVLENEEGGYWGTVDVISSGYPNPFMVKISRKMSEISDQILVCSAGMSNEFSIKRSCSSLAFWNRTPVILSSGIIPFCSEMLLQLSLLNDMEVHKYGAVEKL